MKTIGSKKSSPSDYYHMISTFPDEQYHKDFKEIKNGTPVLVWNDPNKKKLVYYPVNPFSNQPVLESPKLELSFGWKLMLIGSEEVLCFASWDDKGAIERLVSLLGDVETLHIQQSLMNSDYFTKRVEEEQKKPKRKNKQTQKNGLRCVRGKLLLLGVY